MSGGDTVVNLLERGAERDAAISAPGRQSLTYGQLRAHVAQVATFLDRNCGIGRNDRVAIVLPNGPEMAVAVVAIAAGATSAPLNPAYRANEFEFYLSDLRAKALLTTAGRESPAVDVADRLGLTIIEISRSPGAPAGIFNLSAARRPTAPAPTGEVGSDDVALVLHTSGTTSRAKMVPLSQRNLCVSARHIAATLALQPADRCLNIMPLFHIHGLVGAVLSSLCAGASVVCTLGFNAFHFQSWMRELRASWYTAVPTMHQAILARVAAGPNPIKSESLRLIRSSSAPLAPKIMAELEAVFGVPAIESYGMTEAAHQITSNPLPPARRKPGTVGIPAGPEVAIMDEGGELLPPGTTGEVVIRGPSVTDGYENSPTANAEAFTQGWLRTGDQGVVDQEGYLTLTGRLKEIINRGGEKISPREVDEVLMNHPGVAQAVAFALPHDKLGEEVAAAVVLRAGANVNARDLRRFASIYLADFKVPRDLLIVDKIPTGPTGKLQRIGLARQLGLVQ